MAYATAVQRAIKINNEYQAIIEIEKEAEAVFRQDFRYEIKWSENQSKDQQKDSTPIAETVITNEVMDSLKGSFKKIRNALARELHPDKNLNSPERDSEFKNMQEAYETGDLGQMLSMADNYNIDIDLVSADISAIEEVSRGQLSHIRKSKKSIKFKWFYSDKTTGTRKRVWRFLNIDSVSFVGWLVENGYDLTKLESEARCGLGKSWNC